MLTGVSLDSDWLGVRGVLKVNETYADPSLTLVQVEFRSSLK